MPEEKIEIENINTPGRTERVNRAKYEAMREALLSVLPDAQPGLKVPEAKAALLLLPPDELFPAGDRAGWWLKRRFSSTSRCRALSSAHHPSRFNCAVSHRKDLQQ
jgi:hypothetical protein